MPRTADPRGTSPLERPSSNLSESSASDTLVLQPAAPVFVPGAPEFVPGATAFVPGTGSVIVAAVPDEATAEGGESDKPKGQQDDGQASTSASQAPAAQQAAKDGWSQAKRRGRGTKESGDTDTEDEGLFKFEEEMPRHNARKKQWGAVLDSASDSEIDDADLDRIRIIVESPDRTSRKARGGVAVKDRTGSVCVLIHREGCSDSRSLVCRFHRSRSSHKSDVADQMQHELYFYEQDMRRSGSLNERHTVAPHVRAVPAPEKPTGGVDLTVGFLPASPTTSTPFIPKPTDFPGLKTDSDTTSATSDVVSATGSSNTSKESASVAVPSAGGASTAQPIARSLPMDMAPGRRGAQPRDIDISGRGGRFRQYQMPGELPAGTPDRSADSEVGWVMTKKRQIAKERGLNVGASSFGSAALGSSPADSLVGSVGSEGGGSQGRIQHPSYALLENYTEHKCALLPMVALCLRSHTTRDPGITSSELGVFEIGSSLVAGRRRK